MTWGAYLDEDGAKHVVPKRDERQHIIDTECWCKPWRHPEDKRIFVHVAKDGREAWERPPAIPRPQ